MQLAKPSRRAMVTICVLGMFLLTMTSIGVYGLLSGPQTHTASHAEPPAIASETVTATRRPQSWQDLPALPATTDPLRYATAVAQAVFTWDTMSGLSPDEYANVIVMDADPSGVETPGLLADLDAYLPSADTWLRLREYRTRQTFTVDAAFIPDAWPQIARESAGQVRDGTTAVTVHGTRHRHGIWRDNPETSAHETEFTVFVACRPAFKRCHTLRLSELGKSLH